MKTVVVLNDTDNVATLLRALEAGASVELDRGDDGGPIKLVDAVDFGHKIAIARIARGGDVLKYGQVIGRASRDIAPGEWVHIHNVESVRARGDLAADGTEEAR